VAAALHDLQAAAHLRRHDALRAASFLALAFKQIRSSCSVQTYKGNLAQVTIEWQSWCQQPKLLLAP
jgi:hypothetical protein